MAGNSKISNLDPAAGLTGTEELPVVQAGETVKTTTQDVADLVTSKDLGTDNLISDDNERIFTLNGSLQTNKLTIEAANGTDIVQFRGDNTTYFPSGVIGQGAAPSAVVGFQCNVGTAYGFYSSKNRTQADFMSFGTTTPFKYSVARLNAGQTGFYVDANLATTGHRRGAHLAVYGTNTGDNIGLKLDVRQGVNNYALEVLDGDFRFGTSNGTKIATATNQKISFYGATPIVQGAALTAADATLTDGTIGTNDIITNNLRTRLDEIEARLSTSGSGLGLFA
mgnify:CR=1 FL=1